MEPTDDLLFKELRKFNAAEAGALDGIARMLKGISRSGSDRRFDEHAIWQAVEDRISEMRPPPRRPRTQQGPPTRP